MKGLTKCFGVFFLFFIMLGFSLSVSFPANATTFSIDSFLSHGLMFPAGNSSLSAFPVSYTFASSPPSDVKFTNTSYLISTFDSSSGKCRFSSYNNPGYSLYSTSVTWDGFFVPPFVSVDYLNDSSRCMTMTPFGYNGIPEFDSGSIPFSSSLNVNSMLPYNFMYNTIPLSNVRTVDGVDYPSSFDVSELLNNPSDPDDDDYIFYSDALSSVSFPLNWNNAEFLEPGKHQQLSGTILFPDGLSSSDFSNLYVEFSGYAFYSNGSESLFSSAPRCNISSQNDDNSRINFLCDGVVSDISYYWSALSFTLGSSSVLSSTKQPIVFSNFRLVTNDLWTLDILSGSFSRGGSFPNVAPGVAHVDASSADFFSSFSRLFNFSVLNPFSGLFGLFSDNDSCASIPIISGLIHSNETEVCPWFPSDVRNVMTPVLGISSMMLIFGFVVHWLSSSSGNFFDDSLVTGNRFRFKSRGVLKS